MTHGLRSKEGVPLGQVKELCTVDVWGNANPMLPQVLSGGRQNYMVCHCIAPLLSGTCMERIAYGIRNHESSILEVQVSGICAALQHPLLNEAPEQNSFAQESEQRIAEEGYLQNVTVSSSVHKLRIAIVGNGPVGSQQRPVIQSADVVIRFNTMHSW